MRIRDLPTRNIQDPRQSPPVVVRGVWIRHPAAFEVPQANRRVARPESRHPIVMHLSANPWAPGQLPPPAEALSSLVRALGAVDPKKGWADPVEFRHQDVDEGNPIH